MKMPSFKLVILLLFFSTFFLASKTTMAADDCQEESLAFMHSPNVNTNAALSTIDDAICWSQIENNYLLLNHLNYHVENGNKWAALYLGHHISTLDGAALEDALQALGQFSDHHMLDFMFYTKNGDFSNWTFKYAIENVPLSLGDDLDLQRSFINARRNRIVKINNKIVDKEKLIALVTINFRILGLDTIIEQEKSEQKCTPETNKRADSLLAEASRDWYSLLRHQKKFAVCSDGALAEGYSEAVAHLLAHHLGGFHELVTLVEDSPHFRHWIVRHIDATASDEDLKNIVANATICFEGEAVAALCKSIRRAAQNALVESAQIQSQSTK